MLILQLSFVFPSFGLFYIAVVEAHEKRIPIVPVLLQVPYLLLHVLAILLRVHWICESACNAFSSCSSMFSLLRLPLGAVTSGSRRRLLPGGSGASSAMPTLSHERLIVCSSLQSRASRSCGKASTTCPRDIVYGRCVAQKTARMERHTYLLERHDYRKHSYLCSVMDAFAFDIV